MLRITAPPIGSAATAVRALARVGVIALALTPASLPVAAQERPDAGAVPARSAAREWNEALLFAIRRDFARPTVHARNLFHLSAAMYDVWAVHDAIASPYFLGRTQRNGQRCDFGEPRRAAFRDIADEADRATSRRTAIGFAMYRLLRARFAGSPGEVDVRLRTDELFAASGLDPTIETTDVFSATPAAALGNLVADCVLAQGAADGANEAEDFANRRYSPVNGPLDPTRGGNPGLADPNRWQPLQLDVFVDQSGNATDTPFFLGAEWSEVLPFALSPDELSRVERDGETWPVYLDPGPPALLGDDPAGNVAYIDGHALVALWSAHLDPDDGVVWDVSPGSIGDGAALPEGAEGLDAFYDRLDGGASGDRGHALNPATGEPYAPNPVPRGDYTRVLAEFWADGPDSETPPGHWFRLYNETVADHALFERRFAGEGPELDALEFDVKAYFLLGGAMHDSAIAAWSVKGAYDYARPISAIRYMAERGQSSDPAAPSYSVHGAPLVPDRIELVGADDPLAGNGGANVGKIKVRAWRGPDLIADPDTDTAGVGWILMERWWPYQRPSFVTPPFAGYVSGHSTFSRAAAEVLTRLTGDPFFPGGVAEFTAERDEFLVFEDGPSVDVTLQWATYRDASDQTSLSRIWGGIHPPVDDVPGRRMGIAVAERSWARARSFFDGTAAASEAAPSGDGGEGGAVGGSSGGGCSLAGSRGTPDPLLALLALLAFGASRRRDVASRGVGTGGERPACGLPSRLPLRARRAGGESRRTTPPAGQRSRLPPTGSPLGTSAGSVRSKPGSFSARRKRAIASPRPSSISGTSSSSGSSAELGTFGFLDERGSS